MRGGHRQPVLPCRVQHGLLPLGPVDAERLAGDEDLSPLALQLLDGSADGRRVVGVGDMRVRQRESFAGGEFELAERGEAAGEHRRGAGPDADQSDGRDVALQEGVGGLGRAVRQEGDVGRGGAGLFQKPVERLDDAVCDAVLVMVAGGDLDLPQEFESRGVHGHGVGEGSAHVDADADAGCVHAQAPPCAGSVRAGATPQRAGFVQ